MVRTGAGTASSIAALVFRYSVVPETYAAPNMIEAPAMPSNDAHAEFQKDTGAGEQSAAGLQSSGFQPVSQPANSNTTQSSNQSANSSGQPTNAAPQEPPQQKKKSKWKIPSVPNLPIPQ